MNELTEQYNNDALPDGDYYVEFNTGNICRMSWNNFFKGWYNVKQVLEKVPSYQKYAAMKAGIILAKNIIDHMEEENIKLKKLLREARIYVAIDTQDYDDRTPSKNDTDEAKTLLKKIDEVLK